jgi:molybdopterin synthase catalytic subunit
MSNSTTPEQTQPNNAPTQFEEDGVFVALTHDPLDAVAIMNKVRSPKAGAIVLFAGTL